MLMLDEGLPRRRTLLLHETKKFGEDFLAKLRIDIGVFTKLTARHEQWAKNVVRSSPFSTRAMQQLCLCAVDEDWKNTPRITV